MAEAIIQTCNAEYESSPTIETNKALISRCSSDNGTTANGLLAGIYVK